MPFTHIYICMWVKYILLYIYIFIHVTCMYMYVYMHACLHVCDLLFLLVQVQFLYHFIYILYRNLQIDGAIDFHI